MGRDIEEDDEERTPRGGQCLDYCEYKIYLLVAYCLMIITSIFNLLCAEHVHR